MEQVQPPAPAELPPELVLAVLRGQLLTARSVCRLLRDRVDASVATATLRADAPPAAVRALLLDRWGGSLEVVRLEGVECLTDALLAELLERLPKLRELDVSRCSRLGAASYDTLQRQPAALRWTAGGCWRLWRPCKELGPEAVLDLQIAALRANGDVFKGDIDGVAKCFEFAAPDNAAVTGPLPRFAQMIALGYPVRVCARAVEIGRRPGFSESAR